MADLKMDRDQVGRQLKELTELLDLIDAQAEVIKTVRARQRMAVRFETDVSEPPTASFAGAFGEFAGALKDIRDCLGIALIHLRDSAGSLANQDAALRACYARLAKRLDPGVPKPAPRDRRTQLLPVFGDHLRSGTGASCPARHRVRPCSRWHRRNPSSTYNGGTKLS